MTPDLIVQYASDKPPLVLSTRDVETFKREVVKCFHNAKVGDVSHLRVVYCAHEEEEDVLRYIKYQSRH